MEDRTSAATTHDLLLALAGRVDDDLLAQARELAAIGEDARAVELVTASLVACRAVLPEPVRAAVVAAARGARTDLDPAAALPASHAGDGIEHRFSAPPDDDPVAAALLALPPRALAGCRVLLAHRRTPAGQAPGPLPHPVVLVEAPPERSAEVLAYQVGVALDRRGVPASVEVLAAGAEPPAYHAAALRRAVAVISPADAEQQPAARPEREQAGARRRFPDAASLLGPSRPSDDLLGSGILRPVRAPESAEPQPVEPEPLPKRGAHVLRAAGPPDADEPEDARPVVDDTVADQADELSVSGGFDGGADPLVEPAGDTGLGIDTGLDSTVDTVFESDLETDSEAGTEDDDEDEDTRVSGGRAFGLGLPEIAGTEPVVPATSGPEEPDDALTVEADETPEPLPLPDPEPDEPQARPSPRPVPMPSSRIRRPSIAPIARASAPAPIPLVRRSGPTPIVRPIAPPEPPQQDPDDPPAAADGAGETAADRPAQDTSLPGRTERRAAADTETSTFDAVLDPLSAPRDEPLLASALEPTAPEDDSPRAAEEPSPDDRPAPATAEDEWASDWFSGSWAISPGDLEGRPQAEPPAPARAEDDPATPDRAAEAGEPDAERAPRPAPRRPARHRYLEEPEPEPVAEDPAEPEPQAAPEPVAGPAAETRPHPQAPRRPTPETGSRPEPAARLSEADRQLLARLQAELLEGRKPRLPQRRPGTHGVGTNGFGGHGLGGTNGHRSDPPDLAG